MFDLNAMSIMRRDRDRRDDSRRGDERGDDNRGDRSDRREENSRDDNRSWNEDRFENPRSLHGQEHGNNSDRGNYRTDSHFNQGYGRRGDIDYDNQNGFNSSYGWGDRDEEARQRPGGARYTGDDWYGTYNRSDNPYGRVRQPDGQSPYRDYGLRDHDRDRRERQETDARREDEDFRRSARDRNSDTGDYGFYDTHSGQDFRGGDDPIGSHRQYRPDSRNDRDRDNRR